MAHPVVTPKLSGNHWTTYLYLAPLVILLGLVTCYPFFSAVWISLFQKNLINAAANQFVGIQNYLKLFFGNPDFWPAFVNSVIFTIGSVFFEYLIGLISALTLNSQYIRGRNIFRAIILLPWVVPIIVNSLMWKFILTPNNGFVDQLLASLGFPGLLTVNWLGEVNLAMASVIFVNVWRSFPFYTIVLLAGLAIIPPENYEAAYIDGASLWQSFKHITMPGIKNVSMVVVVLHLISTFVNFDVIYLLTGGGPLHATEVLPTLLYRYAFENFDLGYASAIGVFILVFLLLAVGRSYTKTCLSAK